MNLINLNLIWLKVHIMKDFISKYITPSIILLFIGIIFLSCKKDPVEMDKSNNDSDDNAISLEGDLQISDFVWEGLNNYYYWQEEVADLADDKAEDIKSYAQFININSEPTTFFNTLQHPNDRFSWIQDDYRELENTLQGVYSTNGVEFGLLYACENCNQLIGFVKYILKGSDAEGKNIKRGDFFTAVNGTALNVNNYIELLFSDNPTYSLNMATTATGSLANNGIIVELTKEENFETNPIQENKIIDTSAGKVGYIMYNQFVAEKSPELNEIFEDFKSQGITELVLDLRYNGGGSVRNCVEIARMITGQFKNQVFAQEQWNSKLNKFLKEKYGSEQQTNRFVNTLYSDGQSINSLELNRLYVLTSSESASASELLINGLSPFIEVIQIGENTVGKNVGSITVYDYIDNDQTKNPDHTYAMQPIVLKIANSEGFSAYSDGLEPDVDLEEDIRNLGSIGDVNETFLAVALNLITETGKFTIPEAKLSRKNLVQDPLLVSRQRMILDKDYIKTLQYQDIR